MEARLPDSIGRFKVLSMLGRGAMGVVYKARDPHLERMVALKIIRADLLAGAERDTYLGRFHDEARIAALCNHANVVKVHEFAFGGGQPHLVLEYVEGTPLSRVLPRRRRLSMAEIRHVIVQILDALHHAHEAGIVHCDIKPANLLLTRAARLKITDFGISRLLGGKPAGVPLLIGTPSYMSPEQCLGEPVDHRSDFFSLGAVLYELLTGERPFQGLTYTDTVFKLINQPHHAVIVLRPDLPPEVGVLIDRALAKKAADRFTDVRHFKAALEAIAVDDQAPAAIFRCPSRYGFTLFEYEPTGLPIGDDREEVETVRLTPAPPVILQEGQISQPWQTHEAAQEPHPIAPPAKTLRRRTHFSRMAVRIGTQWRRMVATLTMHVLATVLGYRPRREED